jgi:hypothetical protein
VNLARMTKELAEQAAGQPFSAHGRGDDDIFQLPLGVQAMRDQNGLQSGVFLGYQGQIFVPAGFSWLEDSLILRFGPMRGGRTLAFEIQDGGNICGAGGAYMWQT